MISDNSEVVKGHKFRFLGRTCKLDRRDMKQKGSCLFQDIKEEDADDEIIEIEEEEAKDDLIAQVEV